MARLIPLFFLMIVAAALFALRRARPRNRATYRPRAAGAGAPHGKPGVAHVMTRTELAGVRDAYSSATIDPSRPLTRCGNCQAVYHRTSFEALRAENAGRCAICGSTDLGPVTLADQHDA